MFPISPTLSHPLSFARKVLAMVRQAEAKYGVDSESPELIYHDDHLAILEDDKETRLDDSAFLGSLEAMRKLATDAQAARLEGGGLAARKKNSARRAASSNKGLTGSKGKQGNLSGTRKSLKDVDREVIVFYDRQGK